MKKIITLFCCAFCLSAYAQHKPLKEVQVGDYPGCKVRTSLHNNFANTTETYAAAFELGAQRVSHEIGIKHPDLGYNLWGISTSLDSKEDLTIRIKAKMNNGCGGSVIYIVIGEKTYAITSWYYAANNRHLLIDLSKEQIEHMSISGFQAIYLNEVSDDTLLLSYSDVSQELWRRCAKEVYNKRKYL